MLLAYDGDCGFCQASIELLRHHVRPSIPMHPWQSLPPEHVGQWRSRLSYEVLLFSPGAAPEGGACALATVMRSSPSRRWRALGTILALPMVTTAAQHTYREVARHRHQLPGGSGACRRPDAGRTTPDSTQTPDPRGRSVSLLTLTR